MRFGSTVFFVSVLWGIVISSGLALGAPVPDILTKRLEFPSPVQWKVGGIEVSLIGVAWGPADSPEMISKGLQDVHVRKAEFYPDRSYVLALNFRAKVPHEMSNSMIGAASGLGLVKNVDGDIEAPMNLTQSGFTPFSGSPGVFDIRFDRSSTTEYWDLFPVSREQREFLFEVFSNSNFRPDGGASKVSFKIIRKDDDFAIVNSSPGTEKSCVAFNRNFEGTMGADVGVKWQLTRQNTTVSGTERYTRIGTTLRLQGTADSLGNVVIEEHYPKDVLTGVFKGAFAQGCHMISGFFSKPDGSRLQPFELHGLETPPPTVGDQPSSPLR